MKLDTLTVLLILKECLVEGISATTALKDSTILKGSPVNLPVGPAAPHPVRIQTLSPVESARLSAAHLNALTDIVNLGKLESLSINHHVTHTGPAISVGK